MSDTPDLDKARESAASMLIDHGCEWDEPIDAEEDLARLILEQRAEEAERCLPAFAEIGGYGRIAERAADLRRQAGGGR